ncbi:unnamed protein product [Soboliphyme baturini]|uniref:Heat shock protein 70 n=1 Tax=Soboliphyme baturini TaxID=241478 RepID=A0A183IT08_9BILA|nr:unnamed protein product [Soboliphyme baturini]
MILNGTKPQFDIPTSSSRRLYYPEEISAKILLHLRKIATDHFKGRAIAKAVMSVPAEFDDQQRNATVQAAQLAGFDVLRVVNEPTAAALAYGLHEKPNITYVLIVDLGGGTLDVSLLLSLRGMFVTIAMADVIRVKFGASVEDDAELRSVRAAAESAKLTLTYETHTVVNLTFTSLHTVPTATLQYNLSRTAFEDVNRSLFLKVLQPIEVVLRDANLTKVDIDEIVLIGGSTRIPKIRQLIAEYFDKSPNCRIDPELAVGIGVAMQAGILEGAWPLQVSAVELPARFKKIHIYDDSNDV